MSAADVPYWIVHLWALRENLDALWRAIIEAGKSLDVAAL